MTVIVDSHLRCRRCSKRMVVASDDGLTRVHECWHCDTQTVERIKPALEAIPTPAGRGVPMVYTAEPFPLPDFDDVPPVPVHHERVGSYLLTGWCQRCQQPGKAYTACRCNLPPDRYVRTGDHHA